jgi:hypothetical protein
MSGSLAGLSLMPQVVVQRALRLLGASIRKNVALAAESLCNIDHPNQMEA